MDQRPFRESLAEIRKWLEQPRNVNEFLILFLDDEIDLSTWVRFVFLQVYCHPSLLLGESSDL
jgi:hypothetical protein